MIKPNWVKSPVATLKTSAPWAIRRPNVVLRAKSSSVWMGLTSPDRAENAAPAQQFGFPRTGRSVQDQSAGQQIHDTLQHFTNILLALGNLKLLPSLEGVYDFLDDQ